MADNVFIGETGVQQGDGNLQVNHFAGPAPVVWPLRVGTVPRVADCYQTRAAGRQLDTALTEAGTAVLGQVLSGMGGVGKTQLAAHHVEQAWAARTVDLLVWVTATSRSQIHTGYAQAAVQILGAVPADPETAAERLLAWLAATSRRWLIVLDDVADPADLAGLWPPDSPCGQVLVTTRRRDAALTGPRRRRVEVGVYTPDEAQAYLVDALADAGHTDDPAQVRGLAEDLGFLPLALAQARVYLVDEAVDCAHYRQLLADQTRTLDRLAPGALPDDQPAPVAAALALALDRASQRSGLARPLLHLAAMLDPNGIPEQVLTSPPALAYITALRRQPAQQHAAGPVAAEQARAGLRVLHLSSMLEHTTITPGGGIVRIHQLIQRAVRDQLPSALLTSLAHLAAAALHDSWPQVENDTSHAQILRANTASLQTVAGDQLWQTGGHTVLFHAGNSLGEAGLVTAAAAHFEQLHTIAHRLLGSDHPHTLSARHNLAHWRAQGGDAVGAATALEAVLADQLPVLGPDHRNVLATRGTLARCRGEAGDPRSATSAFEALLADQLRVLGPDHPDTLTTRNNLAHWWGETGDGVGAVAAFEALLADRLRVLGPDHPETLAARGNLAHWCGETGDAVGAVAAFEALLADRLRVLGPDHPRTLTARGNLALQRGEAGDAVGAATALEKVLADQLRVLGPDHPDTLTARNNLAYWRGAAGDAIGAATAFEALLADQLRVLGPDHPRTLASRSNLASWRGELGDEAGDTVATFEGLLADLLRVLGPDHPDTLTNRGNHAHWKGRAGDAVGAAAAFEALLADLLRVLGPDHPDTLTVRNNLAYWRGQAGHPADAADAFEALLADQLRVLGPGHPHTLATRSSLASWRRQEENTLVEDRD